MIVGFKHRGFQEEQELRFYSLVTNVNENLKFREQSGIFVPYIELKPDQNRLPIKEIIISPTNDVERVELGLRLLLEKKGYTNVEIKHSKTPYRTG
jgi:hypothetical protein